MRFSGKAADSIAKGIAVMGMSRKEVYVSMGPPASADGIQTREMTYEQIMGHSTWVWRRKRFGKNIGVTFDPASGLVTATEGIWKK